MEGRLSLTGLCVVAIALVGLMLGAPVAEAQSSQTRRIVILRPPASDGRVALAHEAIDFWNQVLSDLQLSTRLVQTTLVATAHGSRVLENYTRQVWQQAGRLSPGLPGPAEPSALASLNTDVVLFLSVQPTMSFAWPLRQLPGHFVAVPAEPVTANVIAHELGHVLGLSHHDDPAVLMCSPCPLSEAIPSESFLPLTDGDRARLRELYSVDP